MKKREKGIHVRTLTDDDILALCRWAVAHWNQNWGGWKASEYPLAGCSYLSYEDNPIVVKFDQLCTYAGQTFRRVGWSRCIPGREPGILFVALIDELRQRGLWSFDPYPTRIIDVGDGRKILIQQDKYAHYPLPQYLLLRPDGSVERKFTKNSKWFQYVLKGGTS